MKIIYQKSIVTAFIGIILSFHSIIPTYMDYFCNNSGFSYKKNCSFITVAENVRYITNMLYYRLWYKKTNLDDALVNIEEQLHHFEQELLLLEQKALDHIKEKYTLSDALWFKCLDDIKKTKQSYAQSLLNSYQITTWDPAIADIKELLIPLLKENNINPESINVVLNTDENGDFPNKLAETLVQLDIQKNDTLTIKNEYTPATITIFPSLLTQTFEGKMSICAHEVQHLALQHSITMIILMEYLSYYAGITKEDFRQSKEYYELVHIHEAQAEVIAAIKNPIAGRSLAWFRSQHYYPDYLYEKHFCQLATIHTLWKTHDKLENLYFSPRN